MIFLIFSIAMANSYSVKQKCYRYNLNESNLICKIETRSDSWCYLTDGINGEKISCLWFDWINLGRDEE